MNTLARFSCVLSLLGAATLSATPRYPDSGLYDLSSIFDSNPPNASYVRGRTIGVSWADLESGPNGGVYDFSKIESALSQVAAEGRIGVIKINGGTHPAYLFSQVPYAAGVKLHHTVADAQGTLMYWHPNYIARYHALLDAFGDYLANQTSYGDSIGLIRLNYNAIGTEITSVPSNYRNAHSTTNEDDPGLWTYPGTMTDEGVPNWTDTIGDNYMSAVTQDFVDYVMPHVRVLARANLDDSIAASFQDEFDNGGLGWFHTGASMEENQYFDQEFRYKKFLDDCRPGTTFGFSEQCGYDRYVDQYIEDNRIYFTELQYNYWRLLSELHCGVSYIGVYGEYLRQGTWANDYGVALGDSFRFAQKYAGYHADPLNSPGAWVALRGGGTSQTPAPGAPESGETEGWDNFRGDYNLLMSRIPGDGSVAVTAQGPNNQRYGSWARQLGASGQMYFNINDGFFGGPLNGAYPVTINVTYLNSGTGSLSVYYDSTTGPKLAGTITKTNPATSIWQTASFTVPDGQFNNGLVNASDINLSNSSSPTVVHMVELTRATELYEAENLLANANGRPQSDIDSSLCSNWAYHRTLFPADTANDWVEYTIDVPQAGTYNVRVVQVKGPDRGIWRLKVNGTNLGLVQNGYNSTEEVTQHNLGSVTLPAGANAFRFQINNKAAGSSNYHLGIDAIKLTKK